MGHDGPWFCDACESWFGFTCWKPLHVLFFSSFMVPPTCQLDK